MSIVTVSNRDKYLIKVREYLKQIMSYLNSNQLITLSNNVLKILSGNSKTNADLETRLEHLSHFKKEFQSALRSYERLQSDEADQFRNYVNNYAKLQPHVYHLYRKIENDIKQMEAHKTTETPAYNSLKKFVNMLNWWFIFVKRFLGREKSGIVKDRKPNFHPTIADKVTFNHISKIIMDRMQNLAKITPQQHQARLGNIAQFASASAAGRTLVGGGQQQGQQRPQHGLTLSLPGLLKGGKAGPQAGQSPAINGLGLVGPGGTPLSPLTPGGVVTPVMLQMIPGLFNSLSANNRQMLINLGNSQQQPPPPPSSSSKVGGGRVTRGMFSALVKGKGVGSSSARQQPNGIRLNNNTNGNHNNNHNRRAVLTEAQKKQQLQQQRLLVQQMMRIAPPPPPPPGGHRKGFRPPPPPPNNNNTTRNNNNNNPNSANGRNHQRVAMNIRLPITTNKKVVSNTGGVKTNNIQQQQLQRSQQHPIYSFPSIHNTSSATTTNGGRNSSSSNTTPQSAGGGGVNNNNPRMIPPRILLPTHSSLLMKGNNNNNLQQQQNNNNNKFPRVKLPLNLLTSTFTGKQLKGNSSSSKTSSSSDPQQQKRRQQQQQQQQRKIGVHETNRIFQTSVQRLKYLQEHPNAAEVGRIFRSIQTKLGNDEDILFIGRRRRNMKPPASSSNSSDSSSTNSSSSNSSKNGEFGDNNNNNNNNQIKKEKEEVNNEVDKLSSKNNNNNNNNNNNINNNLIKSEMKKKPAMKTRRGKKFDDQSYVPPPDNNRMSMSPEQLKKKLKLPINLNLKKNLVDKISSSNNYNKINNGIVGVKKEKEEDGGKMKLEEGEDSLLLNFEDGNEMFVNSISSVMVNKKKKMKNDNNNDDDGSSLYLGNNNKRGRVGSKRKRPKGFGKENFISFSSVIRPPPINSRVKKKRKLNHHINIKVNDTTPKGLNNNNNNMIHLQIKPGLPSSASQSGPGLLQVGWDGRRVPMRDEPEEMFPTLDFLDEEDILWGKRKRNEERDEDEDDNEEEGHEQQRKKKRGIKEEEEEEFLDDGFLFDDFDEEDEKRVMIASTQIKKSLKFVRDRFKYDGQSKEAVVLKVNNFSSVDCLETEEYGHEACQKKYIFSTKPTVEQNLLNNHIQCYRVTRENVNPDFILKSSGDIEKDWKRCNEVEKMLIQIETTLYTMEIFMKKEDYCLFVVEIEVSPHLNEFHVICRFCRPNIPNFRVSTKDRSFKCSRLGWNSNRFDEEFNYLYKVCKTQFFDQIDVDWKKKKLGVDMFFALKCWIDAVRKNCTGAK